MYSVAILRFSGNPSFNRILKPLLKQHIFSNYARKKGLFHDYWVNSLERIMDFEVYESLLLELPVGLMNSSCRVSNFKLIMMRIWRINP